MGNDLKGCIFDLDGVLVNTARYHYLAWKRLASELGFEFSERDNESLKGVSRMRSLEILLVSGNIKADAMEKERLAAKKNEWYLDYITKLSPADILPGSKELIISLREKGIKTAVGSASNNAGLILDRLSLTDFFDVVIDGRRVSKAKPDPEVFVIAARELDCRRSEVIVFEDAVAGVEAAKLAGMICVGIGNPATLSLADKVVPGLGAITYDELIKLI